MLNRSVRTLVLLSSLLLFSGFSGVFAQNPKALFYLTRNPSSVRSLLAHASQIDILVPTWYSVDADGLVSGGPNPLVLSTAKQIHLPVMPIVGNDGFNQAEFHKLLENPAAQRQMIAQLIDAAKTNGYTGFQFDFENVNWTDRDLLSAIVATTAGAFHEHGLQLSIAVVPGAPGHSGETGFGNWIYANWRGAYDLEALGKAVDILCLMTYDQHTRYTSPGPVAGWNWTVANLDYALKAVPREKLSLGIPIYGYHWYAGTPAKPDEKPNPTADYEPSQDAVDLAKQYGATVEWDSADRTAWFYFYRDDMREWVFFTDKRTFEERYNLVKERGLQGFCSWDLGEEDPTIWSALPAHK